MAPRVLTHSACDNRRKHHGSHRLADKRDGVQVSGRGKEVKVVLEALQRSLLEV